MVAAWLLCGLLSAGSVSVLAQEGSAADLIGYLRRKGEGLEQQHTRAGVFRCGQLIEDLARARFLVKIGASVLPDIEKELDSIEAGDKQSGYGATWMELLYARLKGAAALPRLRRMEGSRELGISRHNLDGSIALALRLTSYVSDSRPPIRIISCTRRSEPRDAFDQLILGWERNDRSWLESSLAPGARAAMRSLLVGKTWATLRSELWPRERRGDVSVGYRFDLAGPWSEPDETLEEKRDVDSAPDAGSRDLYLDTSFKDKSGADCGKHRVKFLMIQSGGSESRKYLVDDQDLRGLLRTITSCATGTASGLNK